MWESFEIKNEDISKEMGLWSQNWRSETAEYSIEQQTRLKEENDRITNEQSIGADSWLESHFQKEWEQDDGSLDSANMLSDLTQKEKQELNKLVEQSKTPNNIDYLNNSTYVKYLNNIEHDFGLPMHSLECLCYAESGWKLYNWNKIIWSSVWAQWLFQFMPDTARLYMNDKEVCARCGKKFKSTIEFLKNPLATAIAAGVIIKKHMENYNFQTALACYNRWMGNYRKQIGNRNLIADDFSRLPKETRNYVPLITRGVITGDYKDAKLKRDPITKKKEEIDKNTFAGVLVDLREHSRYMT